MYYVDHLCSFVSIVSPYFMDHISVPFTSNERVNEYAKEMLIWVILTIATSIFKTIEGMNVNIKEKD